MSVKIDDIELMARVEETDKSLLHEIRSIRRIETKEKRILLENEIAGQEGDVLRDYGRHAIRVSIEGEAVGDDAKNTMSSLRLKYRTGEPLDFSSDLPALSEIRKIMIASLNIYQKMGEPNSFHYRMAVVEYKEPTPSEAEAPSQEAEEEVAKESDIHDIEGRVLDIFGNPVKDAPIIAKSVQAEYTATANEKGVYWFDDVDEGVYKITVDHTKKGFEDFKGLKNTVEVKKGGKKQT